MTKESPLKDKIVLAVDDEPDVLETIVELLDMCHVVKVTNYKEAVEYLQSFTVDVVILDIMGVNGFELLKRCVARGLTTVMLTAHALSADTLKQSVEMGARAYIPKHRISRIQEFLEDVITLEHQPAWQRLFEKLGDFFDKTFGSEWQKDEKDFWNMVLSGKVVPGEPFIVKRK
ncbi:MAG: response regulator [Deltaproteobacteria bacterium]|nr:response regulator [Deltaproteobacteria bacterium]